MVGSQETRNHRSAAMWDIRKIQQLFARKKKKKKQLIAKENRANILSPLFTQRHPKTEKKLTGSWKSRENRKMNGVMTEIKVK